MSEKLNLYELDIDIRQVIEKASHSQKELEKLRMEITNLLIHFLKKRK